MKLENRPLQRNQIKAKVPEINLRNFYHNKYKENGFSIPISTV
jgi:hypothetical protein